MYQLIFSRQATEDLSRLKKDEPQAFKKGWSRASEACLLGIAVFFGSLGCLAGMYLFRHKTQKKKFTITVPILLATQLALLLILQMGL